MPSLMSSEFPQSYLKNSETLFQKNYLENRKALSIRKDGKHVPVMMSSDFLQSYSENRKTLFQQRNSENRKALFMYVNMAYGCPC